MGWTWLEEKAFEEAFKAFPSEEEREVEMDRRVPLIEDVVNRIASHRSSSEQENWRRQADIEEHGYDTSEPDEFESNEEEEQFALRRRILAAREDAEEEVLLMRLNELGVRMARPYEHWNEEEAQMAYLERDR